MFVMNLTQWIERAACHSPLCYRLSSSYYHNIVEQEIHLADITNDDRVLVIGGGPCPFTGILIHKWTGAEVTVIDNDRTSVKFARNLLSEKGLNQGVRVELCDGMDMGLESFTVIHIALQVSQKEEMVEKIKGQANLDARILIRLPKAKVKPLFSPISQREEEFYSKVQHIGFGNVGWTALEIARYHHV